MIDWMILTAFVYSLYILFLSLAEFILVDYFFIVYSVRNALTDILLVTIFILSFFVYEKIKPEVKAVLFKLTIIILPVSVILFQIQQGYHARMFSHPLIKSVNPSPVYIGQNIEIVGRGFGDEWQKGTVMLNNKELITESWSNNKIAAKTPIFPGPISAKLNIVATGKISSNSVKINFVRYSPSFKERIKTLLKRVLKI